MDVDVLVTVVESSVVDVFMVVVVIEVDVPRLVAKVVVARVVVGVGGVAEMEKNKFDIASQEGE